MNRSSGMHVPSPEFRQRLEQDVVKTFRLEGRFGIPHGSRWRQLRAVSLLLAGLAVGWGTAFARGQAQDAQERTRLLSIAKTEQGLLAARLQLAQSALLVARAREEDAGLGDAGLPVGHRTGADDRRDHLVEIGVVADDRGGLATELERDAAEPLAAEGGDPPTGGGAPSDVDRADQLAEGARILGWVAKQLLRDASLDVIPPKELLVVLADFTMRATRVVDRISPPPPAKAG